MYRLLGFISFKIELHSQSNPVGKFTLGPPYFLSIVKAPDYLREQNNAKELASGISAGFFAI